MPPHVRYRGRDTGRGLGLIGFGGRALLALSLISSPVLAADSWLDRMIQDAGEVKLAPETLAPADYLIAVYAERMQDLPVSSAAIPRVPGPLATGCLSLVNIETASGQQSLASAAELTFGCTDLPSNAVIHVWTGFAWQPLPTDRLDDGRMRARFSRTATYGLFLVGDVPRI